ncbi:MAG TPA: pyridoxal phosphate-dependent aminotransferase [Candidatus Acidoferrales bacterium]|nr:pyridoxal phosphate-dependent aminotransferase [Candidatus Acidoferrales bacterium]
MSLTGLLALANGDDRTKWDSQQLGYIETRGTSALRETIASTYDNVESADVLCFAGAQEGLYCAMVTLLRPGDHAVVLVPNYQSSESLPLSICDTTGLALEPTCNWDFDIDALLRLLRPNTRLVAVNFPNNPTGSVPSQATFRSLVDLCRKRGIYLFSDEVYRGVERDVAKQLPQSADVYERGLSLNVMSKAYGLPGLRVGWVACRDRSVLDQMESAKHYLSIANAGPSELLATIALKARQVILRRNRELCASNLATMRTFFRRHSELFDWYEPDGGCVAYPAYLGSEGVESFCSRLLDDAGILLLPASIYQSALVATPKNRFRIGYGRLGLEEALCAFERFLDQRAVL